MKKVILVLIIIFQSYLFSQLTGTKTIPGDYATIAAAVTALNTVGVGAGGVIFNVSAGHWERSANIMVTATGTSGNRIKFQKSGTGSNPVVCAAAGTGTMDGIIKLRGTDYITFSNIDVKDTSVNSTQTTRMEWGYALLKTDAFDGCQNDTIRNATITMQKASTGDVIGIYSNNHTNSSTTQLTVNTSAGVNRNNKFYTNTISTVNCGIYLSGYFDVSGSHQYYDQVNDVGGSSSGTGNTIQNYGYTGASSSTAGIYFIYQNSFNCNYNTVNNSAGGGDGDTKYLYGIRIENGGYPDGGNINNNIISLAHNAFSSGSVKGIENSAAFLQTGTININNNYLSSFTCASGDASSVTFISNYTGNPTWLNINNNQIKNSTGLATSASVTCIANVSDANSVTIQGNGIININKTVAGGNFTGIFNDAQDDCIYTTIRLDTIKTITLTGATGFYGINNDGSSISTDVNTKIAKNIIDGINGGDNFSSGIYTSTGHPMVVDSNTIKNITTSGKITGLYAAGVSGDSLNIYLNDIYALTTSGSDTLTGIYLNSGDKTHISRNKIYDLTSSNSTGKIRGFTLNNGTNTYFYNNYIYDIWATSSTFATACVGAYLKFGSNAYFYYNTIFIDGSSGGSTFGTASVFVSTTLTLVEFINNIFVNTSTPGSSGYAVAHRRSATSTTNYSSASDYNCFYAGTPSSRKLIFYDGTNSDSLMSTYHSRMGTKDEYSFGEMPPFTNPSSPYNMTMLTTSKTLCESGGTPVIYIPAQDYYGTTRSGSTPDIGAEEFSGLRGIAGTKYIPGDYSTINNAVTALNAVGCGNVIFKVAKNHYERSANILLTVASDVNNTITFEKNGTGNNPLVTSDAGTGTMDGIIKIAGSDYVKFDYIDVKDSTANTDATTRMEWGYAILKASGTNGSQHITIQNCNITLQRIYNSSIGIYSNNHTAYSATQLTVTSLAGTNSDNSIQGDSVQNVNSGIWIQGFNDGSPYTYYDQNNSIGTVYTNYVSNFGGTTSTCHGIYTRYNNNITIQKNYVNNKANGGVDAIRPIYGIWCSNSNNNTVNVSTNVITLSESGNYDVYGIYTDNAGSGSTTINTNQLNSFKISGSSSVVKYIYQATACSTLTIAGNTIGNADTLGTSGDVYVIHNAGAVPNSEISGNTISNIDKSSGSGTFWGIANTSTTTTGGTEQINNNEISDITIPYPSSAIRGIYSYSSTGENKVISGNILTNIGVATGSCYGIYSLNSDLCRIYNNTLDNFNAGNTVGYGIMAGSSTSDSVLVYGNTIKNFLGDAGVPIAGINIQGGNVYSVNNNNIYSLRNNNAGATVYGVVGQATNLYIYNNFISDLHTPYATGSLSIAGIYINNTSGNDYIFYNTILIKSLGTGFGSAGIYTGITPSVEMQNNIICNLSTASLTYLGTMKAVAYQRSGTSLTTYSANSNRNCFYVGNWWKNSVIYYDGTNFDSTLNQFQTRLAGRDANSISEYPPFLDTASTPKNLHLSTTLHNMLESSANPITTPINITQDYDGNTRNGTTPDIGADEISGLKGLRGTRQIPGNYFKISDAVNLLNLYPVGSGGITFNVLAGHYEKNSLYITGTGGASTPVTFQKLGIGNNPLIVAGTGTGSYDGIFILEGSDYITMDGIDLKDTTANTTGNTRMEYGYALLKASATNGSQYNTIKNCTITLQRINSNITSGIYMNNHTRSSATQLSITNMNGINRDNTFFGNTVQNTFYGFNIQGYAAPSPYTYYDVNNYIGIESGTGNLIQNFGDGLSNSYGIFSTNQTSFRASYNTINNSAGGGVAGSGVTYGISCEAPGGSAYIKNNTITLAQGNNSSALYGISIIQSSSATISDNILTGFTYTGGASGQTWFVVTPNSPTTSLSVTNNKITNNTIASTGTVYGFYLNVNTPGITFTGNKVNRLTINSGNGYFYGYYNDVGPSSGAETIYSDTVSSITHNGTGRIYGIYSHTATTHTKTIAKVIIDSLRATSGEVNGIFSDYGSTANIDSNSVTNLFSGGKIYGIIAGNSSGTDYIFSNNIRNLQTSGADTSAGIYIFGGTNNVYKNSISAVSGTNASSLIRGINSRSASTISIYNNFISELVAPSSTIGNGVIGIFAYATSTVNTFYNTVYLTGSGGGPSFGTSCLYVSTTPTHDMRNNILINLSLPGASGYAVAYRRENTTLTTYSSNSNNNCLYAGSPGALNLIFHNGTNSDATIEEFKTRVNPRDNASFTELPPFLNTSVSPYDLHIGTTTGNLCESGGVAISSPFTISDDYDNNARGGTPDVGADEFAGLRAITGTKTIPGDYATISAAVTALNSNGTSTGGVTFNVLANHWERSANILMTATGTVNNQIWFRKSGSGNNPKVTAAAGTGSMDGIIKFQGSDYVTFDSIDVSDTSANSNNNTRMEWGYAILKESGTNGCYELAVRSCTITLNKTNTNTIGIYANNHTAASAGQLTVTSSGGIHNRIYLYGNTIQNVFSGITVQGYNAGTPYTYYDHNFTIGGNQAKYGNNISNFGGSGGETYGINISYNDSTSVQYNIINNTAGGGSGSGYHLYGIRLGTNTNSSMDVLNNTITITQGANSYDLNGVFSNAAGTGTVKINNNLFTNNTFTTGGTGPVYFIRLSGTVNTANINNNLITDHAGLNTSGSIYGVSNNSSTQNITFTGNKIYNLNKSVDGGNFYGYFFNGLAGGGVSTIQNDTIRNITVTGLTGFYGIYNGLDEVQNANLSGCVIDSITSASGLITGINILGGNTYNVNTNYLSALTSSSTGIECIKTSGSTVQLNIYQNNINNISAGGYLYGISLGACTTSNIYKNNIYNLTTSTTSQNAYGIYVNGGTTDNIYNNFISDLNSPSSSSNWGICGIYMANATTVNAFYNTIFLNGSSSNSSFGSAGIFSYVNFTTDLRNNIIINKSTPGAGTTGAKTVAYRRTASGLTTFSSNSNNNCYYAGSPGPNNVIFYDNTVAKQTMSSYKAFVTPRDSSSISEDAPFINSSTKPYNLHINTSLANLIESGGKVISTPVSITDDYDGNARNGSTPDIGADEFTGIRGLSGNKYIPGDLATIAEAINYANNNTIGEGGIIFNVSAGHYERGSNLLLTTTGTTTKPIIFQKYGGGNNPLVTANAGISATLDGVITLRGSDYVTFDGIDVKDTTTNTDNTTKMEWGYGLLKENAGNGTQYSTIKNCNITLQRSNTNSVGIYMKNHTPASLTDLTVSTAAGTNSYNKFTGNTIQNVYNGFAVAGYNDGAPPYSYYDQNNEIGGTTAELGNSISNFAGSSVDASGIYLSSQNNLLVKYNTINNAANGGTSSINDLYGIRQRLSTNAATTIENNTLLLTHGSNSYGVYGIHASIDGSSGLANINGNTFTGFSVGSGSSPVNMIRLHTFISKVNINYNQFINDTSLTGSGAVYCINIPSGIDSINVYGNKFNNIKSSSAVYVYYNGSYGNEVISYDTLKKLNSTSQFYGFYSSAGNSYRKYFYNNILDSITSSGNMYPINFNNGAKLEFYNNSLTNLTATSGLMNPFYTFTMESDCYSNIFTGLTAGNDITVAEIGSPQRIRFFRNNINNVTSSSGKVYGVRLNSCDSGYVYNNFIGNLKSPNGSTNTSLMGINVTGSTGNKYKIFYNTIYLNGSSSNNGFGSMGLYLNNSPDVEIKNNIIVNTSAPGTTAPSTIAFFRAGSDLSHYVSSSDYNLYYAGTPGSLRIVYSDGTNNDQTLSAFKTRVSPREANSKSFAPVFASSTDLHLSGASFTDRRLAGSAISGFTTDYDGNTRSTTYPYIGADESNNNISPFKLNLHALIEGFYNGTTMVQDTLRVYIADQRNSYALKDSAAGVLNTSGWGSFYFSNVDYQDYYFYVKHRNSIETWLFEPKFCNTDSLQFDLTTAATQAYGSNLVQKSGKWCIYSGDANQDGQVSLDDLLSIDVDNQNFETGYRNTDVNGDDQITLDDLLITDVNNQNFVSSTKPGGKLKNNLQLKKVEKIKKD